MDTGFCPKCIEVDEQSIIKEEKVIVVHKPIVKIPPKKKLPQLEVTKAKKKKGVCYVKPCDWLDTPSKVSQYEGIKPNKLTKNKRKGIGLEHSSKRRIPPNLVS